MVAIEALSHHHQTAINRVRKENFSFDVGGDGGSGKKKKARKTFNHWISDTT